jgi:DNA-binding MarR family transcriptional regulator
MDRENVIRVRRVVLRLARQLHAASDGGGLTPTQTSLLGLTATRGPLTLAELTELEGLNPTMVSRVVGRLDALGLVRRLRDTGDSRVARAEVTSAGRRVHDQITAERSALLAACVAGLPAGQADALMAALPALENLAEDLRAAVQRGRGPLPVAEDRTESR